MFRRGEERNYIPYLLHSYLRHEVFCIPSPIQSETQGMEKLLCLHFRDLSPLQSVAWRLLRSNEGGPIYHSMRAITCLLLMKVYKQMNLGKSWQCDCVALEYSKGNASHSPKAAVLNLWSWPLSQESNIRYSAYQIFILQFLTVTKLQV